MYNVPRTCRYSDGKIFAMHITFVHMNIFVSVLDDLFWKLRFFSISIQFNRQNSDFLLFTFRFRLSPNCLKNKLFEYFFVLNTLKRLIPYFGTNSDLIWENREDGAKSYIFHIRSYTNLCLSFQYSNFIYKFWHSFTFQTMDYVLSSMNVRISKLWEHTYKYIYGTRRITSVTIAHTCN